MNFNPLAELVAELESAVDEVHQRRAEVAKRLEWAEKFNPTGIESDLRERRQQLHSCEERLPQLRKNHTRAAETLKGLEGQTAALKKAASPGLNPARWLRSKRAADIERYDRHLEEVDVHKQRTAKAGEEAHETSKKIPKLRGEITRCENELREFATFDREAAVRQLEEIDAQLLLKEAELVRLRERRESVDARLATPLKELKAYEQQSKAILRQIKGLRSEADEFEFQIERARRYDRELSTAENSYERRLIHEECERELGNGSPRPVISQLSRQQRRIQHDIDSNERLLQRVQRDSDKLHSRLTRIAEVAARDIQVLVVDGKNCCFQGNNFIALAALAPLTKELAGRFDVVVVFDATIRRDLGLDDAGIRRALPNCTVHVVASKAKADETLLDIAADSHVYVLSNDRFGEFTEKAAVSERRVIRHEILRGRILIHDLDIDLPIFTNKQR